MWNLKSVTVCLQQNLQHTDQEQKEVTQNMVTIFWCLYGCKLHDILHLFLFPQITLRQSHATGNEHICMSYHSHTTHNVTNAAATGTSKIKEMWHFYTGYKIIKWQRRIISYHIISAYIDTFNSDHMVYTTQSMHVTLQIRSRKYGSGMQPCDMKANAVLKLSGTYRSNSHNSIKMVDINMDKHSEQPCQYLST